MKHNEMKFCPEGARTIPVSDVQIGNWLHAEQMDDQTWWVRLGTATFEVVSTKSTDEVRVQEATIVPMGGGVRVLR